MNKKTGEVEELKLNEIIFVHTTRADGSRRIQMDFRNCPSMAEQHTAHLSDVNYLVKKFQPDELAAYITARSAHRQEILGHDFSQEPSLQDAKNVIYHLRKSFEELPDSIRSHFKNHVEWLKFIDNPANQKKMIELGILTKKEIQKHTDPKNDDPNDEKKLSKESPKSQ